MPLIVNRVSKSFTSRKGSVAALAEASLTVADHEFICIVGPSGCGKTTLLKIVAGLVEPDTGVVDFGTAVDNGKPRSAMVFQENSLFPWLNLIDNIGFGLEMRGVARSERHRQSVELMERIGLAGFAHSYPHELSGGMKQRVALARAFLTDPQILLMDEPFGALDAQTRIVLQEELLRIWRETRKIVLFVTHDIDEAVMLGDRVLVMTGRPGRIRAEMQIPLERPRNLEWRDHPELTEIKWHIWKMLKDEVQSDLKISA
jgi:NitT/TauT family transport system ATP-binding protein